MRTALLLFLALSLAACPKKKATTEADAAADAAPVAVVDAGPPPGPEAANANDIARFGDETKIDHEVAKVEAFVAIARKSPPNGAQVARLPKGTEVTKIAQHEKQFLVTFANPKKSDEHLMGWITETSFKTTSPAGMKCKADKDCGAKAVCVPHENGTKCEKECSPTNTAACPANSECSGSGANAEGKQVQWCVSTLPADAGAPKATDAGGGGGAKSDGGK